MCVYLVDNAYIFSTDALAICFTTIDKIIDSKSSHMFKFQLYTINKYKFFSNIKTPAKPHEGRGKSRARFLVDTI